MKKKALIILVTILTALFFAAFLLYLNISKSGRDKKQIGIANTVEKPAQNKQKVVQEEKLYKTIKIPSPNTTSGYSDKDKKIKFLIEKLGSASLQVSQDAAEKLAKLGKTVTPNLVEALKGADTALKGQIIFLLGRIGAQNAVPALIQELSDENAYLRRNAAEALGKIKNEAAIIPLATGLFDEDISVRARSAWALGEIKDRRAVESLLDRMVDERDEMVKTSTVNSLGKIHDQRATLILVKELKSQSDLLYKNEVVKSLGQIGDAAAISALSEHLEMLKQLNPTEKMYIFQQQEAIKITEEAMQKIQNNS